jgi:phosphoglucosamine mutase
MSRIEPGASKGGPGDGVDGVDNVDNIDRINRIPRLFGTDGVRGRAGHYPLDPPTVRRLGAALVRALPRETESPRLLVGRDTRESGAWIEAELAHGASGEGASVTSVGVVPTPAVAYLTRAVGYDAGVVISASHNPFEDNGIKVFSGRGEKFTERVEREVEAIVADSAWDAREGEPAHLPHVDLVGAYLDHRRAVIPESRSLSGFKLAIDCANGATTTVAPLLFDSLGLDLEVIGDQPDGRNINLDCGSTHPQRLARTVIERGCQMGVAFDGDGDRAIFVDARGRVVDGDAVLLMCGSQLQREGRLKGDAIVATVMSNIGLEIALRDRGIDLVRCAVGDKYVMEEMIIRDLSLGGEQSGHIIFSDYLFTGDGLCTALNVLRTVAITGRSFADLAADLTAYPQVLLNVRVRERVDLGTVPAVAAAIARVESCVAGQGRLLVRYSGTEPLLRVMLEGRNEQEIRDWAQEIVDVVKDHLG